MKELLKTIKENTAAIVTALVVVCLVSNYLLNVIPANQQKSDTYNKAALKEFETQFNTMLNDYASQLPFSSLEKEKDKDSSILNINTMLVNSVRILGIDSAFSDKDTFYIKEEITYSIDSAE